MGDKSWILTRRGLIGAGTAAAVAGGAAFSLRGGTQARHAVVDGRTLNRGNGAEPDSLDPHKVDGNWEYNIIADMFAGLMTEDAAGNPMPGAALSYDVSPDGLVYTFHLRRHNWSDGVPVTAHDYVFAFRRILDPKTASPYASILYPIKNAESVNSGKLAPDQVGVQAIDSRTLQIDFRIQVPYVAQLLTHFTTFAIPRHIVEKYGDRWIDPGNVVTNGPFVLHEWVPNDHILLVKNSEFYDRDSLKIDRVYYYPTPDYSAALKRFRAGELDTTNGIPAQEIDWLKLEMPQNLRVAPFILTQYIQYNLTRRPFDDVRVRTALSLAIDREIIARRVMRAGEKAAYAFVPPNMPGYPGKPRLGFEHKPMAARIAEARALLAQAGFGPNNPLVFDYNYQNQTDARLIAVAFQAMWKNVGAQVRLVPSESQVHYNLLRKQQFDAAWSGWVADYRDAKNYLMLWETSAADLNFGRYSNPKYDSLMAQSDAERDPAARAELLQQAEQIVLDDAAFAPIYFGVSRNLVSTAVKGWIPNPVNINRSRFLSLDRTLTSA
ncbi:MAG TPA: peptide ABC transporter substrate-binding protein [Rhizomicrobium sp.]|nr:peptide ABC transporter substrate-binding protein [Rhizomicrobium sp.]